MSTDDARGEDATIFVPKPLNLKQNPNDLVNGGPEWDFFSISSFFLLFDGFRFHSQRFPIDK